MFSSIHTGTPVKCFIRPKVTVEPLEKSRPGSTSDIQSLIDRMYQEERQPDSFVQKNQKIFSQIQEADHHFMQEKTKHIGPLRLPKKNKPQSAAPLYPDRQKHLAKCLLLHDEADLDKALGGIETPVSRQQTSARRV